MLHSWVTAAVAMAVYMLMLTCTFAMSMPKQFLVYLGTTTLKVVTLAFGLVFLAVIALAFVAPDVLLSLVQWQEIIPPPTQWAWSWIAPFQK